MISQEKRTLKWGHWEEQVGRKVYKNQEQLTLYFQI